MPIPYMGSKRKSAQMIFNVIRNFNPKSRQLVDLFCGGIAIGEIFLKNNWSVIANDKNKYVIALLQKTIFSGLPENITDFVSREKFFDVVKNPANYEDWYVGFVQSMYSFANNQKNYLFGKNVELIKIAGHKLVLQKDPSGVILLIAKKYIDGILKLSDWHRRRIALGKVARLLKIKMLIQLQQLERIEQLEQLERLQQLERIEQLEQLQQLEQLELYSKNYNEIEIPKGSIIYCDPPYSGVAEYSEGNFNYEEFWNWVREAGKKNKIYVSEYKAPGDFIKILEFPQKSSVGGQQKHNNQPNECLFAPEGQEKFNRPFFP